MARITLSCVTLSWVRCVHCSVAWVVLVLCQLPVLLGITLSLPLFCRLTVSTEKAIPSSTGSWHSITKRAPVRGRTGNFGWQCFSMAPLSFGSKTNTRGNVSSGGWQISDLNFWLEKHLRRSKFLHVPRPCHSCNSDSCYCVTSWRHCTGC